MAKGSARRTYNRDARGRFASGGNSSAPKPRRGALKPGGGTAKARGSLGKSRAKLAAKDFADRSLKGMLSRRSQKGAVTRAKAALRQAKKASLVRLKVKPAQNAAKPVIRKRAAKKGTEMPAQQKMTKVALTKESLQARLTKRSKTYVDRVNVATTRNERQRLAWKQAELNKQGFSMAVGTVARQLMKDEGLSPDQAWAKAFLTRPRMSTRRGVKVDWGARSSRMLRNRQAGW